MPPIAEEQPGERGQVRNATPPGTEKHPASSSLPISLQEPQIELFVEIVWHGLQILSIDKSSAKIDQKTHKKHDQIDYDVILFNELNARVHKRSAAKRPVASDMVALLLDETIAYALEKLGSVELKEIFDDLDQFNKMDGLAFTRDQLETVLRLIFSNIDKAKVYQQNTTEPAIIVKQQILRVVREKLKSLYHKARIELHTPFGIISDIDMYQAFDSLMKKSAC